MSAGSRSLRWGSIVKGVLVGLLVAVGAYIIAQFLYGLVLGFQARGTPPQEVLAAAFTGIPFQIFGALLAFLGGLFGGRLAARPADTNRPLAGLITGAIIGVLCIVWRAFSWSTVDVWVIVFAVLAVVGGWLGSTLAARKAAEEYEEAPSL